VGGVYKEEKPQNDIIYTSEDIKHSIDRLTMLYPIYDAYLRIAAGQPLRFDEHLDALFDYCEKQENEAPETNPKDMEKILLGRIEQTNVIPAGK